MHRCYLHALFFPFFARGLLRTHLGLLLVHLGARVAEIPGQAEVRDLAHSVMVDQDVSRRQIAVNDLQYYVIKYIHYKHVSVEQFVQFLSLRSIFCKTPLASIVCKQNEEQFSFFVPSCLAVITAKALPLQ